MFSFSDYVRKLTRDAALAGIYDAIDLIEGQEAREPSEAAALFAAQFGPARAPHAQLPISAPAPQTPPASPPTAARSSPPPGGPKPPFPTQAPAPKSHHPAPQQRPVEPPPDDSQGEAAEARRRGRPPKFSEGQS